MFHRVVVYVANSFVLHANIVRQIVAQQLTAYRVLVKLIPIRRKDAVSKRIMN